MLKLLALAIISSAPNAAMILPLEEVDARIFELNGQTIWVRGRISKLCAGVNCSLNPENNSRSDASMILSGDTPIEPFLNRNAGRVVIMQATVDASCRSGEIICLDRAPELTPIQARLAKR